MEALVENEMDVTGHLLRTLYAKEGLLIFHYEKGSYKKIFERSNFLNFGVIFFKLRYH